MTWTRLEPFGAAMARVQPVTVSTSAGGGGHRASMTITVRRDRLPGLAILARDTFCEALTGGGANAGRVRLVVGEDFRCKAPTGGNTKVDTITLRVPLPAGVTAETRKPAAVEHDYQEGWLEITLPEWGRPPAPKAAHQSIMDRVPDPAARRRGASA